jgi:tetratricopeptide (TPR) repeat protein
MNNDVRGLLIQAEQARERGDFKRSLELLSNAVTKTFDERKYEKLVDITASEALIYRHLFASTGIKDYLILAKHSAMASVEIARKLNDPTALCVSLYNAGKIQEDLQELELAIKSYKEAIEQNIDRPAMIAEMKTRLAVLEFKQGDSSAMDRFESALSELKSSNDKDNYAKAVWESGAYMHMAEALIETDKDKAKQFLSEAEKVIASDMRLKLRKEQLEKLKTKLSTVS